MLRTRKIMVVVLASGVVTAALGGNQYTRACADVSRSSFESMDEQSRVATASQPAKIFPEAGPRLLSSSSALRLTLRPTEADPDAPFLAQVFVATKLSGTKKQGPGQLLGVVSFFPLNLGQAQDFVLPAPKQGFPSVMPQNVELTVKLIPANPARSLGNTSVEVVNAQFAK